MRMTLLALAGVMLTSGAMAAKPPAEKPDVKLPPMPAAAPVIATPPLAPDNTLLLDLSTGGRVTIQMRPDVAPRHVERIEGRLVRPLQWHDLPPRHRRLYGAGRRSDRHRHRRLEAARPQGRVQRAAARPRCGGDGARRFRPDSANSQFYIVLQPTLKLDGAYTVWGRVTDGMGYVDAIEKGEPPEHPSKIVKATLAADAGAPAMAPAGTVPGVVSGAGAAMPTAASAPAAVSPAVVAPAPASPSLSPAAADAARTGSVVETMPMPPSASAPAPATPPAAPSTVPPK